MLDPWHGASRRQLPRAKPSHRSSYLGIRPTTLGRRHARAPVGVCAFCPDAAPCCSGPERRHLRWTVLLGRWLRRLPSDVTSIGAPLESGVCTGQRLFVPRRARRARGPQVGYMRMMVSVCVCMSRYGYRESADSASSTGGEAAGPSVAVQGVGTIRRCVGPDVASWDLEASRSSRGIIWGRRGRRALYGKKECGQ